MENTTRLYAVQNFERTRIAETVFFTEWDDARMAATHKEPANAPGFDYSLITEFDIEDQLLEEIRMTDTEALLERMDKSKDTNLYYYFT